MEALLGTWFSVISNITSINMVVLITCLMTDVEVAPYALWRHGIRFTQSEESVGRLTFSVLPINLKN
jgi:hypothetical protein